jgi:pyochelin biosynthesis protein PchC
MESTVNEVPPLRTAVGSPAPEPDDVVWRLPGSPGRRRALLVLPHAGGNAHSYAQWREFLPGDVQLLVGQYPGRGARFTEALPGQMSDLARPVAASLPSEVDDLVILGHSMGALVAFEVARALTGAGLPPRAFIASACRAPFLPNPSPVWPETLSDDDLVAVIQSRGGTDDGILDEPELRPILLPPIRADFALDDAYQSLDGAGSLPCPVTMLGGADDPVVPADALAAWSQVTDFPAHLKLMPGGHFYFQQQMCAFMAAVNEVLGVADGQPQFA